MVIVLIFFLYSYFDWFYLIFYPTKLFYIFSAAWWCINEKHKNVSTDMIYMHNVIILFKDVVSKRLGFLNLYLYNVRTKVNNSEYTRLTLSFISKFWCYVETAFEYLKVVMLCWHSLTIKWQKCFIFLRARTPENGNYYENLKFIRSEIFHYIWHLFTWIYSFSGSTIKWLNKLEILKIVLAAYTEVHG